MNQGYYRPGGTACDYSIEGSLLSTTSCSELRYRRLVQIIFCCLSSSQTSYDWWGIVFHLNCNSASYRLFLSARNWSSVRSRAVSRRCLHDSWNRQLNKWQLPASMTVSWSRLWVEQAVCDPLRLAIDGTVKSETQRHTLPLRYAWSWRVDHSSLARCFRRGKMDKKWKEAPRATTNAALDVTWVEVYRRAILWRSDISSLEIPREIESTFPKERS